MLPVQADRLLAFRIGLSREIFALVLVGPLPLAQLDPLSIGIRPADGMLGPGSHSAEDQALPILEGFDLEGVDVFLNSHVNIFNRHSCFSS